MSMNPSKVLLITLVGPYGEVDVAVRADLPAAELVPAFKELVGRRGDRGGRTAGSPGASARHAADERSPTRAEAGPAAETARPRQGQPGGPQGPAGAPQGSPGGPQGSPGGPQGSPGGHAPAGGPRSSPGGSSHDPAAVPPPPAQPHAHATWYAPPAESGPAQPQSRSARTPAGQPGPGDIPLEGTLADAGIVDGMVLYLYQPREGGS